MFKTARMALSVALATAGLMACTLDAPRIYAKTPGVQVQAENWYSIKAEGEADAKALHIYIYGEIGYWGVTSGDFIRDLQAVDDGASKVIVHFDSIGGDLFDGIAIHNALFALGERCTASIDGACFSAASVAACGAHTVTMAPNALFMIHNPWTYMAGDSEALRKMADMMDKALEGIITSYQRRPLTVSDAELRAMIQEETWLTAEEAKAKGFVDEVLADDVARLENIPQGKILNRYRNVPQAAKDLLASPAPQPTPEPTPQPEPQNEPDPDPVALAAKLTSECAAAGIANLAPVLINNTGLKSEAVVLAAVKQAKEIKALCVLAKVDEAEAERLITANYTVEKARAALFDQLVKNSTKVELNNQPPVDPEPAPTPQAFNPQAVYAARKSASKGAHK